jgi:branched-chain amino acid transport system substrate-binding protein
MLRVKEIMTDGPVVTDRTRIPSVSGWMLRALAGLALGLPFTVQSQTIKVGVIAPLTGGSAPWGIAAAQGPKLLAEEINAQGGLDVGGKKLKVQIIAYDDQEKTANAVAAYNRLISSDDVHYMIIMSSADTLALRKNVEDDRVLALTSSYSIDALPPGSQYMYRLFSPPAEYLPSLIRWIKDNVKARRVVLVNPNDDTGWSQNKLSDKLYRQNGFDVLGLELFERSQHDFQPMITKIMALDPDLVDLSATPPATAGVFIRQARDLGYKGLFIKTGGAGPKDIVAGAGSSAAEGLVNMLYADPANSGYQRIVSAFRKSVGQDPNEIIVAFYDGANVLLHAIQKAGVVDDTAKVAAAFPKVLPMTSIQGDTLTYGDSSTTGVVRTIKTVNYIGVIRGGVPTIIGKTN